MEYHKKCQHPLALGSQRRKKQKKQERKITGNLITSFASGFSTDLCECHRGRETSSLQKHDWRYVPVCERRRFLSAHAVFVELEYMLRSQQTTAMLIYTVPSLVHVLVVQTLSLHCKRY